MLGSSSERRAAQGQGASSSSGSDQVPALDEKTAVIVVDMQNDFADPRGSLYVSGGDDIVPRINSLIARARERGALIAYTLDWHPEQTPHFERGGGSWPVHCVRGTWGASLHPGLVVAGEVVRKGTRGEDGYSGFSVREVGGGTRATELEGLLRRRGIERLVIVGLATDWCVKETALDARRLGFDVTIDTRSIRAVERSAGDERRALEAMRAAGVRLT